jgi:hypothetical protein
MRKTDEFRCTSRRHLSVVLWRSQKTFEFLKNDNDGSRCPAAPRPLSSRSAAGPEKIGAAWPLFNALERAALMRLGGISEGLRVSEAHTVIDAAETQRRRMVCGV